MPSLNKSISRTDPLLFSNSVITDMFFFFFFFFKFKAMARDIKLNNYQHTPKKLKKMCTLYLVTCGAGSEIMSPSSQKGDEKKLTECSKPATVLGAPGTTPPTTAKKLRRRRRKSQPATTEQ
mmetsp:Transcript_1413/g.4391  ORF Transcript_1413/g.4391 Transcript_1413/m.4391 type:complete len:122 (-) Transcript_1413:763-1128(-)